MASGPMIPGNRVYPGTRQHWTYEQRIATRDIEMTAVWISLALLATVAFGLFLQLLWP